MNTPGNVTRRAAIGTVATLALAPLSAMAEARVHTPTPGTPKRKAICGAMRVYAQQTYKFDPNRKFLWMVKWMSLKGNHACFEGYAVKPNQTEFTKGGFFGNTVVTALLHRTKQNGWSVVLDLTRSDVPSDAELKQIRSQIPARFPKELLTPYWRKKLR